MHTRPHNGAGTYARLTRVRFCYTMHDNKNHVIVFTESIHERACACYARGRLLAGLLSNGRVHAPTTQHFLERQSQHPRITHTHLITWLVWACTHGATAATHVSKNVCMWANIHTAFLCVSVRVVCHVECGTRIAALRSGVTKAYRAHLAA